VGGLGNRVAVAAVVLLVVVVAADALRGHVGGGSGPAAASTPVAISKTPPLRIAARPSASGDWVVAQRIAPAAIALRGSPETMFLASCAPRDLHLRIRAWRALALTYDGPPCHVPPLELRAVVRDRSGAVLYRGAALAGDPLSQSFAGSGRALAPLRPALIACRHREPVVLQVAGSGLAATGLVRCRRS
jgi:hypothetical protein